MDAPGPQAGRKEVRLDDDVKLRRRSFALHRVDVDNRDVRLGQRVGARMHHREHLRQDPVREGQVRDAHEDGSKAPDLVPGGNRAVLPGMHGIPVPLGDKRQALPLGILEIERLAPVAPGDLGMGDALLLEAALPPREALPRDPEARPHDAPGPAPLGSCGPVKEGDVGPGARVPVGVEEVIGRDVVLVHGFLHEPKPEHLRVERVVLSGLRGDRGQVVQSGEERALCLHGRQGAAIEPACKRLPPTALSSCLFMSEPVDTAAFTKDHPFPARVTENRLLSGAGSTKETRHFVVSLVGSGLTYKAGDSLGIFPSNRQSEVEALLGALGASGLEPVMLPKVPEPVSLGEALASRLALADPGRRFLQMLALRAGDPREQASLLSLLSLESLGGLPAWLEEREFIDLLQEFPSARLSPQELVDHMHRLQPRLYSVASSPRAYPEEVHLMVAIVRYMTNGRGRVGVCSTYLADRVALNAPTVPVFVSPSHFGPPEDGSRDMVMVGPGTGIAPFRGFMQDRAASGARGRNWIFFGDQRRESDFVYREEFEGWQDAGLLARFDTAFSRDQPTKVYVQDRMRERAAGLWSWINSGAYFYVCGDAKRMAKDVDSALHEVIAGQGGMTPAEAADYVKLMKKEKRYLRDVY